MVRTAVVLSATALFVCSACERHDARKVDGGGIRLSGSVPKRLPEKPEPLRGLMRYAKRTAELHVDSPRGPVVGRLLKGAFVSIAPDGVSPKDTGFALVASLGPSADKEPLVAYVEKTTLESTFVDRDPPKPVSGSELRATFGFLQQVWYGESPARPMRLRRCHEVLVRDEGRTAFQELEGVELEGYNENPSVVWLGSPVIHHSLVCPAHAVARRGAELVLIAPNPHWEPGDAPGSDVLTSAVSGVPTDYLPVVPPEPDRLASTIERGGSLYWLIATDNGPRCDKWRTEFIRKLNDGEATTLEARLLHGGALEHFDDSTSMHYPAKYRKASGGKPARLHLDTLRTEGHLAMRCICEYDYRILSGQGDEVFALARPIPDDAVAFDPREAERWFFTKNACEAHRDAAVRAIERDGRMTTRVGFHATELL